MARSVGRRRVGKELLGRGSPGVAVVSRKGERRARIFVIRRFLYRPPGTRSFSPSPDGIFSAPLATFSKVVSPYSGPLPARPAKPPRWL